MIGAYNSSAGRWISRDPVEELGGTNLFGYVSNEPIGTTDQTGLTPMADLLRYMKAICDSGDCVPCPLKEKCINEANQIAARLQAVWVQRAFGRSGSAIGNPYHDQVNGYRCWDYAVYFKQAIDSIHPVVWHSDYRNWNEPVLRMSSNGKTYQNTHWAVRLGTNNIPKCNLTLDDSATGPEWGQVHSGSWMSGPNYWPETINPGAPQKNIQN